MTIPISKMLEEARNTLQSAIRQKKILKSELKELNIQLTESRSQDKIYYNAIKQALEERNNSERAACDVYTIYNNNLDIAMQELRKRNPGLASLIYHLGNLISEKQHSLRCIKKDVELYRAVWLKIGEEQDDDDVCVNSVT